MTDTRRGPEFYRQRAELMRTHAKYTSSEQGRFVYLELAAYWEQLADVSEKSSAVSGAIRDAQAEEDAAAALPEAGSDSEQRVR